MNQYYLITNKKSMYVRYIKSGSCLSAAKLTLKSEKIDEPQFIHVKNMIVIIPDKKKANIAEIWNIHDQIRPKQNQNPPGIQVKLDDFQEFSTEIKTYKYTENALAITQVSKTTASIYLSTTKDHQEESESSWFKLPWIVVMFGIAIAYNIFFREPSSNKSTGNALRQNQNMAGKKTFPGVSKYPNTKFTRSGQNY